MTFAGEAFFRENTLSTSGGAFLVARIVSATFLFIIFMIATTIAGEINVVADPNWVLVIYLIAVSILQLLLLKSMVADLSEGRFLYICDSLHHLAVHPPACRSAGAVLRRSGWSPPGLHSLGDICFARFSPCQLQGLGHTAGEGGSNEAAYEGCDIQIRRCQRVAGLQRCQDVGLLQS
jgi:hypothetical protein